MNRLLFHSLGLFARAALVSKTFISLYTPSVCPRVCNFIAAVRLFAWHVARRRPPFFVLRRPNERYGVGSTGIEAQRRKN